MAILTRRSLKPLPVSHEVSIIQTESVLVLSLFAIHFVAQKLFPFLKNLAF